MHILTKSLRFAGTLAIAFVLHVNSAMAERNVTVTFLGNTTLVLDDGRDRILTDGFLSRLPIGNLLSGKKVKTDAKTVNRALADAKVHDAAAIFVAHAHFDHAMDVAHVADMFNAQVFGSRSTRSVALAGGMRDSAITVLHDERQYRVGQFKVTPIYTPHGDPNRFPGELRPGFKVPARMKDFLANENYSFHFQNGQKRALVVPGGNYLTGKLEGYRADTVFLGIGGLNSANRRAVQRGDPTFIEDYWRETVTKVKAKTVVPIHWDNFFVPLEKGVAFRTPPAFIENFSAARRKLEALARRDGVCIHWMRYPFTKITLNRPVACFNYDTAEGAR